MYDKKKDKFYLYSKLVREKEYWIDIDLYSLKNDYLIEVEKLLNDLKVKTNIKMKLNFQKNILLKKNLNNIKINKKIDAGIIIHKI